MKKTILFSLLVILPSLISAQSSDGTIKRQSKSSSSSSSQKMKSKKRPTARKKHPQGIPVIVSNVYTEEQFLNALGSNKTIVIHNNINLSSVLNHTLKLSGYNNLTITGKQSSIRLGVTNGQNLIIDFESCNNVSLNYLVLGHETVLSCWAGVLDFKKCKNVSLTNCDIYGCGYYGIEFDDCQNIVLNTCNIHDCATRMLVVNNCEDVRVSKTIFKESDCGGVIDIHRSNQVYFDTCSFEDSQQSASSFWKCFDLDCNISLRNCIIRYKGNIGDTKYIVQKDCRWQ